MRFRRVDPALFPVAGPQRRPTTRAGGAARERVARRLLAHWADGTLAEAGALVTDDVEVVAQDAAGRTVRVRGLVALGAHPAGAAAHPGRAAAGALVGPTAVALVHADGDGMPGAMSHWTFRDGRVAAVHVFRAGAGREG
ncbi:MAG: hypothetical protein ACKOTZ_10795 [Chloroflexota bacterium]